MSTKASSAWKGLSMFTSSGILQAASLQTPESHYPQLLGELLRCGGNKQPVGCTDLAQV